MPALFISLWPRWLQHRALPVWWRATVVSQTRRKRAFPDSFPLTGTILAFSLWRLHQPRDDSLGKAGKIVEKPGFR